jgi:transcriptional regulator with AAA-type ATPase domain/transcriptional regulatory protein LevR
MMRIDKVKKVLQELGGRERKTASEIADLLGASRSNVSGDLNKLCAQGIIQKSGSRPVYYSIKPQSTKTEIKITENTGYSNQYGERLSKSSVFDQFVKKNPSLSLCIEMAKAAVLYPANNMHILITGETGVGKSMFAQLIFNYAAEQNMVNDPKAFVRFNCADYANNKELLMGHIFGSVKGAYTGAEQDRIGLLEKADGGILFLDEIHRLPPEGQEMLFGYIDNGVFSRMGETGNARAVKAFLIGATTENLHSTLLQTFLRRFPVQIKIPDLEERRIEERLNLIITFFTNESRQLGLPIKVSANAIHCLLRYNCENNLGQLKSDIQLLCAKAYTDYVTYKKDEIYIAWYMLPLNIRNGYFSEKNRKKIYSLMSGFFTPFIIFDAQQIQEFVSGEQNNANQYRIMEQCIQEMQQQGAAAPEIIEALINIITSDIELTVNNKPEKEIFNMAQEILTYCSAHLNKSWDDNMANRLSIYVNDMLKQYQLGNPVKNPCLPYIEEQWPLELETVRSALKIMETNLDIVFPDEASGYIALFLLPPKHIAPIKQRHVQIIVIMHGKGVGTGIASTVNEMLGTDTVAGFDIILDEHRLESFNRMRDWIRDQKILTDILILFDMGSPLYYVSDLYNEIGINMQCYAMSSTMHVIEACRKAMLGYALADIYQDVTNLRLFVEKTEETSSQNNTPNGEDLLIPIIHADSNNHADILKQTLDEKLDFKNGRYKTVMIQLNANKDIDRCISEIKRIGRPALIISSFPTSLGVPHFTLLASAWPPGIEAIQNVIDLEEAYTEASKSMLHNFGHPEAPFIVNEVKETIGRISRAFEITLDNRTAIELYHYICKTIQDIIEKKDISHKPAVPDWIQKYSSEISLIREECDRITACRKFFIPQDIVYSILNYFIKNRL